MQKIDDEYLGDGVYASFDGRRIKLEFQVLDKMAPTVAASIVMKPDTIVMEPDTLAAFDKYRARVAEFIKREQKECQQP